MVMFLKQQQASVSSSDQRGTITDKLNLYLCIMPLQQVTTLYLSSPLVFSGVHVAQSLVFCVDIL
jgi:hypothetical protein